MALTNIKIKKSKDSDKPFRLTDGFSMYLLLHPDGSKYWRMQFSFAGKPTITS